ncbi:hypothetical protein HYV79_04710 [Candidatus Woesearchaeota archaeon]|nr:hypothetical protein [Candidatus Woesearchaeota archaeon]
MKLFIGIGYYHRNDVFDKVQKLLEIQVKEHIDTNLRIINTSYYSMFFAAK